MDTSFWLLAAVVAFGGLASALLSRKANRNRVARFDDREDLSLPQLMAEHFSPYDCKIVEDCLARISAITGIAAGRLRPLDRFQGELKLPTGAFIAGEWDEIEEQIERSSNASPIENIADYVSVMAAHQSAQPAPGKAP